MSDKTSELNELIEITRDGKVFYEHARDEVKDVQLKSLFTDMADTKAALSSDEDATYIAQLEEAEDRILHAFEEAMDGHEPDLRAELATQMPKVRACHDRMRDLKKAQK